MRQGFLREVRTQLPPEVVELPGVGVSSKAAAAVKGIALAYEKGFDCWRLVL